jgi:RHS repeat-associated protein
VLGQSRLQSTDSPTGWLSIAQHPDNKLNEVLAVYNYSPFGLELGGSHQNQTLSFDYTFGGKEANAFAGLTDFGARWLDKPLGVWRQIDPLAESYMGASAYNYTLNNPILLTDPSGLTPRYSWVTGTYWENGEEVSWDDVKGTLRGSTSNVVAYLTSSKDYSKALVAALNDSRIYATKGLGLVFGTTMTEIQSKLAKNYGSLENLILVSHGGSDGHIEANSDYTGEVVPDDMSIIPVEINDYMCGKTSKLFDAEIPQIEALKNIFGQVSQGGNCIIGACCIANDLERNNLKAFSLLAGSRINIYANTVKVRYSKALKESQPNYFFNIGGYLNGNNTAGTHYLAYSWLKINTSGVVSTGYRILITGNSVQPIKIEKK